MAKNTSGTYLFQPSLADIFVEAFERLGIYGPALTDPRYIISARRSANIILSSWANLGVNLWTVGDEPLSIAMQPGVTSYTLPRNVVDLLDCYLRQYTPNSVATAIGHIIKPMWMNNKVATTDGGEPMLIGAPSGTLSCTAGSQSITLRWPGHCLQPGDPIFWTMPVSIGTLMIANMSIVETVIDSNNVTFIAPAVAPITSLNAGATPLLITGAQIPLVECILPNHGLCLGEMFTVQVPVTLGGITIAAGAYEVQYVQDGNQFYFNPTAIPTIFVLGDDGQILTDATGAPIVEANAGTPTIYLTDDQGNPLTDDQGNPLVLQAGTGISRDAKFENDGRLLVTSQQPGLDFNDIYLWPLSRSEYAMLPDKEIQGRPTQYWFNRTIVPSITVWPVPPPPVMNVVPQTPQPSQSPGGVGYYGFIAYRMRTIQDADPVDGQAPDIPTRFYAAFSADLTAALAEKFRPEKYQEKMQIAAMMWERAASADTERVSLYVQPAFQSYY